MYATLLAFLNPGDEVICIEPFFDQYTASIIFNGGRPVYVPLHPPANLPEGRKPEGKDWSVDFDELRYVLLSPRPERLERLMSCAGLQGCRHPQDQGPHPQHPS